MLLAADLHLHTRHAGGVSKHMDLAAIAAWACRKGLDVLGTGDCLQPDHLADLERSLEPAAPGWFALRPEVEQRVVASLARPLRFVLSTEINCAPEPAGRGRRGLHHLVYFPSFAVLHDVRARLAPHGDLAEGRPTLRLRSRELLALVGEHEGCHVAPAHVLNPYFSSLGSDEGHATLAALFDDLTPRLFAAETGLTATPGMCRRISALDGHALFACSDAHSLENLGREMTLLDIEPGYDALFAALRRGTRDVVRALVKVPLPSPPAYYFYNHCRKCSASFGERRCPRCGAHLPVGSSDWLEHVADRAEPIYPKDAPPWRERLPLHELLALACGTDWRTERVRQLYERLVATLGDERTILGTLDPAVIARETTPQVARLVEAQRRHALDWPALFPPDPGGPPGTLAAAGDTQLSWGFP